MPKCILSNTFSSETNVGYIVKVDISFTSDMVDVYHVDSHIDADLSIFYTMLW